MNNSESKEEKKKQPTNVAKFVFIAKELRQKYYDYGIRYKVPSWDRCWYTSEILLYFNTQAHSFPFILLTSCNCRFLSFRRLYFSLAHFFLFFLQTFCCFSRQPWLLLQIISLFVYRSTLAINSYTQNCARMDLKIGYALWHVLRDGWISS